MSKNNLLDFLINKNKFVLDFKNFLPNVFYLHEIKIKRMRKSHVFLFESLMKASINFHLY